MPFELSWYIPDRVIYIRTHGETGSQLELFAQELGNYVQQGIAPVHLILDDTQTISMNMKIKGLQMAFKNSHIDGEKLGWCTGVGDTNTIVKVMTPLFVTMLQIEYKRFDHLTQAIAFLRQVDMTLRILED